MSEAPSSQPAPGTPRRTNRAQATPAAPHPLATDATAKNTTAKNTAPNNPAANNTAARDATAKAGPVKNVSASKSTAKARPNRTSPGGGTKRTRLQRVDETSAGGLVVDLAGEVPHGALIGRTDRRGKLRWSLPKGHVEAGESNEQAAVREVAEETGIRGEIFGELGTIDYWFVAEGRRIHKTVHHYLMRATGGELSDADVEVTEVAWVPLPDITRRLAYPDERQLVEGAGRLIAESA